MVFRADEAHGARCHARTLRGREDAYTVDALAVRSPLPRAMRCTCSGTLRDLFLAVKAAHTRRSQASRGLSQSLIASGGVEALRASACRYSNRVTLFPPSPAPGLTRGGDYAAFATLLHDRPASVSAHPVNSHSTTLRTARDLRGIQWRIRLAAPNPVSRSMLHETERN